MGRRGLLLPSLRNGSIWHCSARCSIWEEAVCVLVCESCRSLIEGASMRDLWSSSGVAAGLHHCSALRHEAFTSVTFPTPQEREDTATVEALVPLRTAVLFLCVTLLACQMPQDRRRPEKLTMEVTAARPGPATRHSLWERPSSSA